MIANYYFSDWDNTTFEQYIDSKCSKDINKDIHDNLSEPKSSPEKLFAGRDQFNDIKFTKDQNEILKSEEVSKNKPLKVALFKWFMYIWNRVKILVDKKSKQDKNGKEESKELHHNRDKPENQQRNPSQKQKCTSSKQKQKYWWTTHRDNVRGACKKIVSWIFNESEQNYSSLIALKTEYIGKRKLKCDDQGVYHFKNCKK